MKLTGKAKEEFEKYFTKGIREDLQHRELTSFYDLSDSMKYGVYVDYFDSVGVLIDLDVKSSGVLSFVFINGYLMFDGENKLRTRPEARTKAIEKANELYNKC